MQLPPAFSLPHDERIGKAIELAYDRDFSHIPYGLSQFQVLFQAHISTCSSSYRVLSPERRPLGYIDVAALKSQWEGGKASPVSAHDLMRMEFDVPLFFSSILLGRLHPEIHDQVQAGKEQCIHAHHPYNAP